jgi:predicted alpha/beta superfamily hydrolase
MDKPAPFFGLFHLLRLAACFIPFLLADATAQDLPGQRVALQSATLKEQRVVQVLLPEGHKPGPGERYDVLYILDGDGNLRTIADILRFGQAESQLPPIILVAVFNTHRDRDMAPGSAGGAANFLSFFKDELIPHIDKAYPTSGRNLLFGHSLAGLFAVHALLSEPQHFDGYLAIDPSLWWDGGAIIKLAAGRLGGLALAEKTLFIAGRDGEGLRQMGIVDMDAALKGEAPKGLSWKVAAYPGETHGSIRLKGVYDGLRFFYDGYSSNAVVFHPMNGRVLEGEPYKVYLMGGSNAVRYTTDGSAPTASSPVMPSEITLSNGARISAKVVGRNDRYNKTTVGSFSVAKPPATNSSSASASTRLRSRLGWKLKS